MSEASARRRDRRGAVTDNGRVGDSFLLSHVNAEVVGGVDDSTSDEDDGTNPSATVNGAAVGRTIVSDIVGGSGVGVNYGGRRRRVLDTVVAVDVDRRGSSVATPNVGSSSVILRRSVLRS